MSAGTGHRELLVSKGWGQAVAPVVSSGSFVLGLLAYRTYTGQPLIPGIFGFPINPPTISYYEIGTALKANHGHAAMTGIYGMLDAVRIRRPSEA